MIETFEKTVQVQDACVAHVYARAEETLYPKVASYYMGPSLPVRPRCSCPIRGACAAIAGSSKPAFPDSL